MSKEIKLDANETKFLKRELEHIKSKTYDKKYAELKARQIIPVSFEAGEHAESLSVLIAWALGQMVDDGLHRPLKPDRRGVNHIVRDHPSTVGSVRAVPIVFLPKPPSTFLPWRWRPSIH